jgi:alcohol dehydrogenase class IV
VHGFAAAVGARLRAPHGVVCGVLLPATFEANWHALRERAPRHPALDRITEVAQLLTARATSTPEDAIAWLEALKADLRLPGLAHYGATESDIPVLVAAAREASSMRANPIALHDEELAGILSRSL